MPFARITARATFHLKRLLPGPAHWHTRPRPFFRTLHALLNREGEITLGQLVEVSGRQTYGLLILLLALPSLVPGLNVGTAPVGGLVIMAIGAQLAFGVRHPRIPDKLRQQRLYKGKIKEALAKFERILDRLRLRRNPHRELNHGWIGLLVIWTAYLLAMPVPVPFGNIAPALVLCLLGAALLEERPAWVWVGAMGSLAVTVYFALSFNVILHALRGIFITTRHRLR